MWPVTLSGRLPVKALVGHYPTNKLIGREHIPHHNPNKGEAFHQHTMQQLVLSGISHPFRQLSQSEGQITHVLLTRSPLEYPPKGAFPLDLHVLSTPPAFVLSQDQTLHRKPNNHKDHSVNNKQSKPDKTRSTSKQSPESSFVNSKKPNHPNPTKQGQDGRRFQTHKPKSSTNTLLSSQKSDAQQLRPVKGLR